MADFGYDISDYTGIDPLFGTMADFDALVTAAHERRSQGSSSIWCRTTPPISIPGSSKAGRRANNPKRDWYIWRDPAPDGGVPNNWLSEFGGSAWQYDEATGQYYYHAFLAAAAGPELAQRSKCARRSTT